MYSFEITPYKRILKLIDKNKLQETLQFINKYQINSKPRIGLILGSGLGSFADQMDIEHSISFSEIPHFSAPTIVGHSGRLLLGSVQGVPVLALQGRIHYYEGHSMKDVTYPVFVMSQLGVETLIVTNSSGGFLNGMKPGDFMVIEDHINLIGENPLRGPNDDTFGPRFPDMSEAYNKDLTKKLIETMEEQKVSYQKGIYCGVSGPTYETPAEIRFFKTIGAGAVGMSTVPEVIIANYLNMKVCGISCITNLAAGLSGDKLNHQEVTDVAQKVEKDFSCLLINFIQKI